MEAGELTVASAFDGDALVAAVSSCRHRVRDLLYGADGSLGVPACPEWTVQQLTAHLAGVATAISAGDTRSDDPQAWIDRQVAARADRSLAELLDEWDAAGAVFDRTVLERPRRWAGTVYDVITHEHDLRAALGRPGARAVPAIDLCLDIEAWILDHDLRNAGGPAAVIISGARRWLVGDGSPQAALELNDGWELFRALGSRRSRAQLLARNWSGEADAIIDYFHLPLPKVDLVE